jgi:ribosomal RNA assembly protein
MQNLYIPHEKVKKLRERKELIGKVERLCKCRIKIEDDDDLIEITGGAYEEYSAKNIIYAFGRGFDIDIACKLFDMDYYFSSIDLGQIIPSSKRIKQVKARVIGEEGRTKTYIENVSGAKMSIYGDTVSFIGRIGEINEAETAVNTLIEGGTHRLAYSRMEAAHRKNKEDAKRVSF